MLIRQLFDTDTSTYTYIVADPSSREAVLIDPVSGHEERDVTLLTELGLTLTWVVETHVHADHVTSAAMLRDQTGCQVAVPAAGGATQADRRLNHGDTLTIGGRHLTALHTPGHTEGAMSYVTDDRSAVFTGDTLLIRGCGRTDFQGGSAEAMYRAVHAHLYTLPSECAVYPGHDYTGQTASTIGEEKAHNRRLAEHIALSTFVQTMDSLNLAPPRNIDVAVPRNRHLGRPVDPWSSLKRGPSGAVQASVAWMLGEGREIRRIDIREPHEYAGSLGHIPDTELVPMGAVGDAATQWDPSEPLLLVCRSGGRSDRAAIALEAHGFTHVASLTGGTLAYNEHVAASEDA